MARIGTGIEDARVVDVADGVHAYLQPNGSWYLSNAGFVSGRQGVISIDTAATERRTRAYLAALRRVSTQPVRTLVNTHHHDDHTFGNCLLPEATIVGHERCRTAAIAAGPAVNRGIWTDVEWGELSVAPPFLTYASGITLWSDDVRCDVRYVGTAAHTTNDSIIHLPEHAVVFTGDLVFNEGTPFVLAGSLSGAIEVLETVLRPLQATTIVPGHGPVCGPDVIDKTLGYLRFVQEIARQGWAAGVSPLEVARQTDLGEYARLLDPERIVGNLHRAYAELSGAVTGAPLDTEAALRDMVAYNGGRPLTCHA